MNLIILRGKTGSGKTTLLNEIKNKFNYESILIDDIKNEKYGKTTKCNINEDFPEAGKRAKKLMDIGHNVIVEEAFLDNEHIELFKNGLNGIENYKIIYIRLETSIKTAIERKEGKLNKTIVENQYSRKTDDIKGEHIFNTEEKTLDDIVEKISNLLQT